MGYGIGSTLAILVSLFARWSKFDRDRAFYPTVTIVIASYYVLFAAISGSVEVVIVESLVMTVFVAAAVAGFRWSLWIVAAALTGHGVFDFWFHGGMVRNTVCPNGGRRFAERMTFAPAAVWRFFWLEK